MLLVRSLVTLGYNHGSCLSWRQQCLQILSENLLMVCRNSSWGDINIDNDCSIHYNASDYSTPGNTAVALMLLGDNLIRAWLDLRVFVAVILTALLVFLV